MPRGGACQTGPDHHVPTDQNCPARRPQCRNRHDFTDDAQIKNRLDGRETLVSADQRAGLPPGGRVHNRIAPYCWQVVTLPSWGDKPLTGHSAQKDTLTAMATLTANSIIAHLGKLAQSEKAEMVPGPTAQVTIGQGKLVKVGAYHVLITLPADKPRAVGKPDAAGKQTGLEDLRCHFPDIDVRGTRMVVNTYRPRDVKAPSERAEAREDF